MPVGAPKAPMAEATQILNGLGGGVERFGAPGGLLSCPTSFMILPSIGLRLHQIFFGTIQYIIQYSYRYSQIWIIKDGKLSLLITELG